MCRPEVNAWPLSRKALKDNFGGTVDRQTLNREFLKLTKNRNENTIDFLEKIEQIKAQLDINIKSDPIIYHTRKSLFLEQNEANSLDTLIATVDDTLRTKLVLRTLTAAGDIVIRRYYEDQRINSLRVNIKIEEKTNLHPPKQITL